MKNSERDEKLGNGGKARWAGNVRAAKETARRAHAVASREGGACSDSRACAYRWRTGVCPVREAQGATRAHAPTWASIRAAHATLSLSFVTRIGAHTAGSWSRWTPRARTQVHASPRTCTRTCFHRKENTRVQGRGREPRGAARRAVLPHE